MAEIIYSGIFVLLGACLGYLFGVWVGDYRSYMRGYWHGRRIERERPCNAIHVTMTDNTEKQGGDIVYHLKAIPPKETTP